MTAEEQAALVEIGQNYLYPNYRQPPLVLVRGEGRRVWDAAGKSYLDLYAGIAVTALGHGHPDVVAALRRQAERLGHVSNYYYNEPNVLLARELCQRTGFARAFFCNSGTEAIEALLKLARRHFFNQGQTKRFNIIAFERSFHGRTLGALAATGQAAYRDGFGPLAGVIHVPFGDADAVAARLDDTVAGVLVEPVQGEGGVTPAPAGFLQQLRNLTRASGALLLGDEIQTGIGRTGRFLGFEHSEVMPDAVALAKGLGGGVPIGAMLTQKHLETALPPGSHGSTFGGNPLASAVARAVLARIETDKLVDKARDNGAYLGERLAGLAQAHPKTVDGTRGLGLLQALVLKSGVDARTLLESLRSAGVLLTIAGGTALRFSPALNIEKTEIDEAISIVDRVLSTIERENAA
ncbi:MAG TPA: acetylornithine/succinylornithine family transaminase [Polyangiaceae bacterium]|nr:acetylornithine/succinylornithine family transaminase [Polyangiaceae bacterium]